MGDLTKNFSLKEFACSNGVWVPANCIKNVTELAKNLQVLRYFLGVSIHINSGYRTPVYNKKIGGSENSQHVCAKAADIRTEKISSKCLHVIIECLIRTDQMKQGGLGLYDNFVHYDIRGIKARWKG